MALSPRDIDKLKRWGAKTNSIGNDLSPRERDINVRRSPETCLVEVTGPAEEEGDYKAYPVRVILKMEGFEVKEIKEGYEGKGFNYLDKGGNGVPVPPDKPLRADIYYNKTESRYEYWFSYGGGSAFSRIRITGYTELGPNRWSYTWVAVEPNLAGTYTDIPGGDNNELSHDPDGNEIEGILAYNTIEANNSAEGIQGNSINLANLPEGVTIQPVQGSPIVRADWVKNCNGDYEIHFEYVNSADGSCA